MFGRKCSFIWTVTAEFKTLFVKEKRKKKQITDTFLNLWQKTTEVTHSHDIHHNNDWYAPAGSLSRVQNFPMYWLCVSMTVLPAGSAAEEGEEGEEG